MSMDISVFHSYGLLISEESAALILSHILPQWKMSEPELYTACSSEDSYDRFCEYLNSYYEVNAYGNAEHLRCYRLCDGESVDTEIGEYFYLLDLRRIPSLYEASYASFEEIIQEVMERLGNLIPSDFPYEDYLLEILGETWG